MSDWESDHNPAQWESGSDGGDDGWEHAGVPGLAAASDSGSDSGSSSTSEDEVSPGVEFVGCQVDFLLKRSITAKEFCTTMHWASLAGSNFVFHELG